MFCCAVVRQDEEQAALYISAQYPNYKTNKPRRVCACNDVFLTVHFLVQVTTTAPFDGDMTELYAFGGRYSW